MASTTKTAVVRQEFAVTTHAGITSIEDRALGQDFSVGKLVPVLRKLSVIITEHVRVTEAYRLSSLVAALIAKSCLAGPYKSTMPCQERPAAVNSGCQVDMNRNEVIVASAGSAPFGRTLRRLRAKTLNGSDVVLPLVFEQTHPMQVSEGAMFRVTPCHEGIHGVVSVNVPIFADACVPRGATRASFSMLTVDPLLCSSLELCESL